MASRIWTKKITQNIIKQLRANSVIVEKVAHGYIGRVGNHEVFRALAGANSYLVRYEDDLFINNQA